MIMPLPDLLKRIIGNNGKEKMPGANQKETRPSSRPPSAAVSNHSSPQLPPKPSTAKPNKPKSLSQIVGIHAHSNLKIQHQLQLAETMYDPSLKTPLDSRLCNSLDKCLADECALPYFLQYIESLEKSIAKNVVTCFLQANCLLVFLKENFEHINFDSLEQFQTDVALDVKQNQLLALFIDDFMRLYNQFSLLTSDGDQAILEVEGELQNQLSLLFEDFKDDTFHVEDYTLPLELFNLFWKALYGKIESRYYESFLRSNFYLKYEIDILRSKDIELSDILHSRTAIASTFLDFMNSEDMKRFVDFLITHKYYKTYSGQYSDAVAMYDRFFNYNNKSSTTFLDFSESLLQELQLATRPDTFNADCFDKVAFILIQYFSKTYLPQFLQSESFRDYLANCEAKLKAEKLSMKPNQSCSTHDGGKLTKRDSNASSHSIDLTSDPESLWKRSLKGQLQFTYIDNLGRMNSLFEPPEVAKGDTNNGGGGGKLTNVIKRFTSNAIEEKKKEDDAWRIAESIINDVCSVTIDHHPDAAASRFSDSSHD